MRYTGWFNAIKGCVPRAPAKRGHLGTRLEAYQWKWWVFRGVSGSSRETEGSVVHTRTQEETGASNQPPSPCFFYQAPSPKVKGPLRKVEGIFYQIQQEGAVASSEQEA